MQEIHWEDGATFIAELLGELWSFGSLEKQFLPTINIQKKGIVAVGRKKISPTKNRIFVVELKKLWEFTSINAEEKNKR